MIVLMMEISFKTIYTAKANTNGPTVEFTMANGLTTKWRGKEHSLGVTVEDMLVCTKMIKNMDKVLLNGQMAENTLVNGVKANNTEREYTLKKERKDKAYGKWAKELNGFETIILKQKIESTLKYLLTNAI
jgi:hypothetical protein